MLIHEYKEKALKTAQFREGDELSYTYLGLVSEVGELAGEIKRISRDDGGKLTHNRKRAILRELGDVLWYTVIFWEVAGYWGGPHDTFQQGDRLADLSRRVQKATYSSLADTVRAMMGETQAASRTLGLLLGSKKARAFGWPIEATPRTMLEEIADMAASLESSIEQVAELNIAKLAARAASGTIQGSGEER